MPAVIGETRFCEGCASVKPITEFRRRSRNGQKRLKRCRDCHNRAERKRRAAKRAETEQRSVAKYLTQLRNEDSNERLERLVSVMFQRFGGMQGFLKAWDSYHQLAVAKGGYAAFRCFESIFRLVQYCEESRPDPGQMSEEEVQRSMIEELKRLIRQHPELAVAAAREIGWTIRPPEDCWRYRPL